jgi:ABC-2 type transport system ATP-binding protein
MSTSPGLVVREIKKTYPGGVVANDGVDLEIPPGEVFGLLGPNGAGKTTLVNQILGLLAPDSGTITLGGVDLVRDSRAARRLCSYLPQANVPIDSIPVARAVELMGRIRGASKREARSRGEALLDALDIAAWRGELGSRLSGGVRRLAGFAMAAVSPGELVILDEPTNDVDPRRRRLLWEQIRRLAGEGRSVLLVTHNVLEAERSVDRLAILNRGRIAIEGSPTSLAARHRGRLRFELVLEPRAPAPGLPSYLRSAAPAGRRVVASIAATDAARALDWAQGLVRSGTAEGFELGPTSLEETYLALVGPDEEAVS